MGAWIETIKLKQYKPYATVPNSLHIGHIMLSEAYYEDVVQGKYLGLKGEDEPQYMEFDVDGNLITAIQKNPKP